EMCVDNPRSGFADLFATHPPIESRIAALVKFAGGRDPGPIALPPPESYEPSGTDVDQLAPAQPTVGSAAQDSGGGKPVLPAQPPGEIGGAPPQAARPGPRARSG